MIVGLTEGRTRECTSTMAVYAADVLASREYQIARHMRYTHFPVTANLWSVSQVMLNSQNIISTRKITK